MLDFDITDIEEILKKLDKAGYLFPGYRLYKVRNRLQLLGKGGFSYVYEMCDENVTNKRYAMKVIGLTKRTVTSERFWKTTALQRLLSEQSSNVVRVINETELSVELNDAGKLQKVEKVSEECQSKEGMRLQFILMDKLDNIVCKDKFKNITIVREELRDESEVIKFAKQVGQSIQMAHHNNILHRDIKLENIFWNEKDGQYMLGDFGIAKYVEEGNAETVAYTDGYGAPEIERRIGDHYNATADIYSFGISLYLLLNGLKFPGSSGYYVNMVQYTPDFIFPAPENASKEMTRIIRKMCSYYKEDRYQSMEEVLEDLKSIEQPPEEAGACDYAELDEFATETYREVKTSEESRDEQSVVSERVQKKRMAREFKGYGTWCNIKYLLIHTILVLVLVNGLQTDTTVAKSWQLWVLSIAVLVEAVLMRVKEFHISFGIMTFIFAIYSIFTQGITVSHVILIISLVIGSSVLTAASAMGVGIWIFITLSGGFSWLDYISSYKFSWLVLAVFLIAIDRLMYNEIFCEKISYRKMYIWMSVYDKLSIAMIVVGVLLWVLQSFGLLVVPEVIQQMHLIKSGILVLIIYILDEWYLNYSDEDDNEAEEDDVIEEDEYMDAK